MARMVAMVAMVAVGRAGASYWWMGQNAFGDGSESNGLAQAVEGEVEVVDLARNPFIGEQGAGCGVGEACLPSCPGRRGGGGYGGIQERRQVGCTHLIAETALPQMRACGRKCCMELVAIRTILIVVSRVSPARGVSAAHHPPHPLPPLPPLPPLQELPPPPCP